MGLIGNSDETRLRMHLPDSAVEMSRSNIRRPRVALSRSRNDMDVLQSGTQESHVAAQHCRENTREDREEG